MGLIEILLLAVIQGVTEFLPVSSSGHLVIGAALLEAVGGQPPADLLEVNIFLHLGTLLAILVFFARRVARLLGADRRVIGLLIVGTLPAVCVGLPLKKLAPGVLESPLLAGLMLPCTGGLLIWASRIEPGSLEYPKMGYRAALLTGLFQAVAILPGISRSGSTIAAGLAAAWPPGSSGKAPPRSPSYWRFPPFRGPGCWSWPSWPGAVRRALRSVTCSSG